MYVPNGRLGQHTKGSSLNSRRRKIQQTRKDETPMKAEYKEFKHIQRNCDKCQRGSHNRTELRARNRFVVVNHIGKPIVIVHAFASRRSVNARLQDFVAKNAHMGTDGSIKGRFQIYPGNATLVFKTDKFASIQRYVT
jgi:hypothetical protein